MTLLSMTRPRFALLAGAMLGLTALPNTSHADAASDTLLARVSTTLQQAQTLSADFVTSTLHPTRYSDTQERGSVTLARPGSARIEITRYRKPVDADRWAASGNGSLVVTDGSHSATLITHPASAQYREVSAAGTSPARLLTSLPLVKGFFGTEKDANVQTRFLGVRTWENKRYSVVEETIADANDQKQPATVRELYIGDDNLIHRLTEKTQAKGKLVRTETTLEHVRLNAPVVSKVFTFVPPPDAVPFARSTPQALLAAGAEAPDFAVEDANGATVRLSDLRGKVVVLKFFATWCWTCKQSLPDTNRLAQQYANKDVVVLAVDIWNSRQAFHDWTAKTPYRAIRFTHDDHPQGKDAASALYHVSATPTEFVIGRDGKIAASSVGYEGQDSTLERAVGALLAAPQATARR